MKYDYAAPVQSAKPIRTRWMAPATCGELVQGAIDGNDFLVNCPIRLYATAEIESVSQSGLTVSDIGNHAKVAQALLRLQPHLGGRMHHALRLRGNIPRGKGMASSTADLTAALKAAIDTAGISITAAEFSQLITDVEPSDCVHYPGIAHVNQLTGHLYNQLPAPSNLNVMVVDCGGEIETTGFDRELARRVYAANQTCIREALALLTTGLKLDRNEMIASAATTSARLSQKILYKPQLERLLRVTADAGALGINCAHSGTVIGVLYDDTKDLPDRLDQVIEQSFGEAVSILGHYPIISGGCLAY